MRKPPAIFTIGYQNRPFEALADLLAASGVDVLSDVRAISASRRPGFSKTILSTSLQARSIDYRHFRMLGTPAAGRQAARAGRIAEMEEIFRWHLATEAAQGELAELRDLARARAVCLLCFEADARDCHRRLVADALASDTGQAVQHL